MNLTLQTLAIKKAAVQEILRVAHTDSQLTPVVERFLVTKQAPQRLFNDSRVSGLLELLLDLEELVKKTLH